MYTIHTMNRHGHSWEVNTRFSEVIKLLDTLRTQRNIQLPPLPRRRLFSSKSQEAIKERREALNVILEAMVPEYAGVPEVGQFLQLEIGEGIAVAEAGRKQQRRGTSAAGVLEEAGSQQQCRGTSAAGVLAEAGSQQQRRGTSAAGVLIPSILE